MARTKKVKSKSVKNSKRKVKNGEGFNWKVPVIFLAGIIAVGLIVNSLNIVTPVSSEGAITLYVLTDSSCPVCDSSWIEPRVELDFANVETHYVDVNTPEGQEFVNELSITSLPAAFFASDVQDAGNFTLYSDNYWIIPISDYYLLNIQGTKSLVRDETNTPTIDLFVMSECPYGKPAQQTMINAMDTISGFDLNIHYIGNVYTAAQWNALSDDYKNYYQSYGMCEQKNDTKYYCSLHGPEEVENDIAQLCAMKYYNNWTDFITAHINNDMNISKTIQNMGYNETLMNECINSEIGWNLYAEDILVADELSVSSSPTYVFDNVIIGTSSALSLTNGPLGLLCSLHNALSGCENIDSIQVAQATGSC
ncbi:hypothetical protein COX58_03190 [archaeon CG_4_10_14_0_2_um_filter_Archaea_38_6]|nr:MAG: hypothetical protein COS83_03650 [archaeon CG07_land_8_20_14_0_80_38_8]PJA21923.1 MAG: hypothetical protein COX58_03190 [archaeon CG_4_10_14_0_2_um_filter_Archaea_38_6]